MNHSIDLMPLSHVEMSHKDGQRDPLFETILQRSTARWLTPDRQLAGRLMLSHVPLRSARARVTFVGCWDRALSSLSPPSFSSASPRLCVSAFKVGASAF
jgi:hypothetical protein